MVNHSETRVSKPRSSWVLYILKTADARLYTGITTDLPRRLAEHTRGGKTAAKALRGRAPLDVVFTSPFADRSEASIAEYRVKQLDRAGKDRLIAGDISIHSVLSGDV